MHTVSGVVGYICNIFTSIHLRASPVLTVYHKEPQRHCADTNQCEAIHQCQLSHLLNLTCADCLPQRTTETLCWYKPVWSHPSASIVSSVAVRLLRYPSISWGPRTHISPWSPAAHSVPVSTSISCQQQKQRHTITQTRVNALLKSLCCVEDSPWWVVPVHTLLNSLHCIEDSPWWSYICTPWVIKTCHSIFLHNFDKWWHIFKILSLWTEQ